MIPTLEHLLCLSARNKPQTSASCQLRAVRRPRGAHFDTRSGVSRLDAHLLKSARYASHDYGHF
jgi:hypothetical protein